ncbi:MAG: hypothetical protein ABI304_11930 [Rudaea sp.]
MLSNELQTACIFEYMYRDASNWKTYGEIMFSGGCTQGLHDELAACCEGNELFVAEQVDVRPLQPAHHIKYGGPSELDHAFHEFKGIRAATADDINRITLMGDLSDFVRRMHISKGRWNCALSPYGWF